MESSATAPSAARADGFTAVVQSLTHDARGVARVDGKTTFIDGALPGERVRFRYQHKRARYDTGAVVEILEPSPDRVAPPCRYFGVCGGCTLQHLAPAAQVRAKQQVLAETLEHLACVRPRHWLAPVAGPAFGYRRRARLGVRYVPNKGGVLIGFRERRRSYITPLDACLTLEPRLSALLPPLRESIAQVSRPDRVPQVEMAAGDSGFALVVRHLEPLTAEDAGRLRALGVENNVAVYLQAGDPTTARALWPTAPDGLFYTLPAFDVSLGFGPTDFIQVNAVVNRALVECALALLDPAPNEQVFDLYCGLGNFTLPLARRAARVVGFESDAVLIGRARTNAAANGLTNAEFRIADLYGDTVATHWAGEPCDKLLLDPPRGGAMDALKALPADGPRRIVYVSCNPATLARDSEYLVHARGYRLEAAGVADMFPSTSHIESIALFVKP